MKYLILLGILCLRHSVAAQYSGENRKDYSPYGKDYDKLNFEMMRLAPHGNATQITYFDMNFVNVRMQQFMDQQMGMVPISAPIIIKRGGDETFTLKYVPNASMGSLRLPYISVKYHLFTNHEEHPIIKSCEIYGDINYIVYFYAKYWPTNLNFDLSGPSIAYSYLLQDKATISLNRKAESAIISIKNTTIKNEQDYKDALNKMSTQE